MGQRNPFAVAAKFKKGGSFHHKCEPRGGTKNTQREIMSENDSDMVDLTPFWATMGGEDSDTYTSED